MNTSLKEVWGQLLQSRRIRDYGQTISQDSINRQVEVRNELEWKVTLLLMYLKILNSRNLSRTLRTYWCTAPRNRNNKSNLFGPNFLGLFAANTNTRTTIASGTDRSVYWLMDRRMEGRTAATVKEIKGDFFGNFEASAFKNCKGFSDRLTDWLTDWLKNGWMDWLTWLNNWTTHWLTD